MLPVEQLTDKLSEGYYHATNDNVEEFQNVQGEINTLLGYYVQQIRYASDAVIYLNKLQLSNIFTQSIKIGTVLALVVLGMIGSTFVPYFNGAIGSTLLVVLGGFGSLYLWKKVAVVRQFWKDNTAIDNHAITLNSSISECIIALNHINDFQGETLPKLQEWQEKGLLTEKTPPEEDDDSNNPQSINIQNLLDNMNNMSDNKED